MKRLPLVLFIVASLLTILSTILLPRIHFSGRLSALFPRDPASFALGRYVNAFGGGDLTMVLVTGKEPSRVSEVAHAVAKACENKPAIAAATTRITVDQSAPPPATLAFAFADATATLALEDSLTNNGVAKRLDSTRALLLSPMGGDLSDIVARDPLRWWELLRPKKERLAAVIARDETGELSADQGRARFVLVTTRGSALDSEEANRVVQSVEGAIAEATRGKSDVQAVVVGGAAIARDVEKLVQRDLVVSSISSMVLVSAIFVAIFRRPRALLSVLPPLIAGTLWTSACAIFFRDGVSAMAMGFASVVIGVGLDTGVHVYAAIEHAVAEKPDRTDIELVFEAWRRVGKTTLVSAFAAGAAFLSLCFSQLPALSQLGVLCALGEVLTAISILMMTPWVSARIVSRKPATTLSKWTSRLADSLSHRAGRAVVFGVVGLCFFILLVVGLPRTPTSVIALRPSNLPALDAQERAIKLSSGTSGNERGQVIVLQSGADSEQVRARADRIFSALSTHHDWLIESPSRWLPSRDTVVARLKARDLTLVGVTDRLSKLLDQAGFSIEGFAPFWSELAAPKSVDDAVNLRNQLENGPLKPLVARHLATDGGELLIATYVRTSDGSPVPIEQLENEVHATDPLASVTGYPVLERSLRRALILDLPKISLLALIFVVITLRSMVASFADVAVVVLALLSELVVVALVVRAIGTPLHAYNALVLPVLIGITVDESVFLLHALHECRTLHEALAHEARAISATALTTAAGFGALILCSFPGLRDIGVVGMVGSIVGLFSSIFVVPALSLSFRGRSKST